jgi:hypothetical protein
VREGKKGRERGDARGEEREGRRKKGGERRKKGRERREEREGGGEKGREREGGLRVFVGSKKRLESSGFCPPFTCITR